MTQIEPSAMPTNQRGRRGFGLPLSSLLLISNAVFFIFSALAVGASVIVFLLARAYEREKDRELLAYQASAKIEIANASKKANEALERAVAQSAANLETAERTAQLEKDTAQLRKDAAEASAAVKSVQSTLLPRRLSQDQIDAFAAALGSPAGSVQIVSLLTSDDAGGLATDLREAFARAGWRVRSPSVMGPAVPFPALGITINNPLYERAVQSAFGAVGLTYTSETRLPDDPSGDKFDVSIVVGSRPIRGAD